MSPTKKSRKQPRRTAAKATAGETAHATAPQPDAPATAQSVPVPAAELQMPAGYKSDGTIATLAEVINPQTPTLELAQLTSEQRREVVVKRLEQLPSVDMMMIGAGHIDKERAITELKANTDIGRTIMEIEQRTINYLLNKVRHA